MPGTPNYPKDMGIEWMNLKRQVKDAFTSANSRVPYKKITAGILNVSSSLKILAGASLTFVYESTALGMILGRHSDGVDDVDGIFVRRNDGSLAMWIYNRVSDGYGYTSFYDQSNNTIFSDDGNSGKGLGRPWIPYTFVDVSSMITPSSRMTGGTTDVAVVTSFANVQHPYVYFVVYIYVAVGGSTVEFKFKDPGLGTTLYAQTAGAGYVSGQFAVNSDHPFGEDKNFDLTIRRASGSGNVGITLLSLMGRQSP